MRIIVTSLSLITLAASLSACNATARDGNDSITINNPDGYHHCPPGHAKKGWC